VAMTVAESEQSSINGTPACGEGASSRDKNTPKGYTY
jgi:hypothetical protein